MRDVGRLLSVLSPLERVLVRREQRRFEQDLRVRRRLLRGGSGHGDGAEDGSCGDSDGEEPADEEVGNGGGGRLPSVVGFGLGIEGNGGCGLGFCRSVYRVESLLDMYDNQSKEERM